MIWIRCHFLGENLMKVKELMEELQRCLEKSTVLIFNGDILSSPYCVLDERGSGIVLISSILAPEEDLKISN